MFKTERASVSEHRFLLQNPYAYMEHLEAFQTKLNSDKQSKASAADIFSSREKLQNPYAYLDGVGKFSALPNPNCDMSIQSALRKGTVGRNSSHDRKPIRHSDIAIEAKVKEIHERLWRDKDTIWNGAVPTDPVDLLDASVALELFGYEYELVDGLGQYRGAGGMLEVAGMIDQSLMTVKISTQFPRNVRAFTAAHEFGHAMLHKTAGGVHRDRPLNGAALSREISEIEADKFATFFLMPAKLVRSRFAQIFITDVFSLDESTSFAIAGMASTELERKCKTRRDLSRLLASTERYDGRNFPSLADQFHVSIETMAIRIEELALIS